MESTPPPPTPKRVYSPPQAKTLEAFARNVCRSLGTDYTTPDVVNGFSAFIKVVADIQATYHTRQNNTAGLVDNDE